MFDKITFYLLHNDIENFGEAAEMVIGEAVLHRNVSPETGLPFYGGYFKTFRLALYSTRLYISNSLSSFIYGHNADDINHQQVCDVIKEICGYINCTPNDLIIKEFEFGFTIPSKIMSSRILKRLISHRNHEAKLERRHAKFTSAKFFHNNYNFKIYDKTAVEKLKRNKRIKISGEWIRIEEQFKKKQVLKYVKTASDLLMPENIENIFSEFLTQWQLIKKMPFINHTRFTRIELDSIYNSMNMLFHEDRLDYVSKDAVKKERERSAKKYEEIGDYSIFKTIEQDFTEKFYSLLNNKNVPNFPALLLAGK